MKKIIFIFSFILLWALFSLWIGKNVKPDLSNDIPDYQEGGGTGHPLWKD